jgi:hypothetical protein
MRDLKIVERERATHREEIICKTEMFGTVVPCVSLSCMRVCVRVLSNRQFHPRVMTNHVHTDAHTHTRQQQNNLLQNFTQTTTFWSLFRVEYFMSNNGQLKQMCREELLYNFIIYMWNVNIATRSASLKTTSKCLTQTQSRYHQKRVHKKARSTGRRGQKLVQSPILL